jgi:hypothetical protein
MHDLPNAAWWADPEKGPPPRHNQHPLTTLKGLYLGMLLRALTGGLEAPGMPEPFIAKCAEAICAKKAPGPMVRSNGGCRDLNPADSQPTCLLTWDGHQRAIETGRVVEQVLNAGVQGAVAEVGVFNGGMAAYLQGILLARTAENKNEMLRDLWLIDSFQGLPRADRMTSNNAPTSEWNRPEAVQRRWSGGLARSLNTVKRNLERYRVLKHNVKFLPGFVNDTLPSWPRRAPARHQKACRLAAIARLLHLTSHAERHVAAVGCCTHCVLIGSWSRASSPIQLTRLF